MEKMTKMSMLISLLFNCVMGAVLAIMLGVTPWMGAVALNVIAIAVGA